MEKKIPKYTFVICAYKESPYLEECIHSLMTQTISVNVILVTSTPNAHIINLVNKYKIPYFVNKGISGISGDWNFAYQMAEGDLVTIAHQDDIYEANFAESMIGYVVKQKKVLIAFSDYGEIREGKLVKKNKLLNTKRLMLLPLRSKMLQSIRFVRRRILSFGSAICCPTVTFVKGNLPTTLFTAEYRSNVDWQAWERISKMSGAFVYCNKILLWHRIHEDSETTAIIADNGRTEEDYDMFCQFWPKWFAKFLMKFYVRSQESNTV